MSSWLLGYWVKVAAIADLPRNSSDEFIATDFPTRILRASQSLQEKEVELLKEVKSLKKPSRPETGYRTKGSNAVMSVQER